MGWTSSSSISLAKRARLLSLEYEGRAPKGVTQLSKAALNGLATVNPAVRRALSTNPRGTSRKR